MLLSDIAMKINQRIENGEEITVDLDLDDGRKVTCVTIIILTVNKKDYIVLLPLDKNGQNTDGNVWFYQYLSNGDDTKLGYISDDDEYESVSEAFDEYLDEAEFDGLVKYRGHKCEHRSTFIDKETIMDSSHITPKNLMKVFSVLCLVLFFCPVFLVSCGNSELSRELSAFELAHGIENVETDSDDNNNDSALTASIVEISGLDEANKPHFILYALIVLPALMLLFLILKDVKNRNVAFITMFLATIDLTAWGMFTYEVKKTAEGAMLLFKVTPWYVINIVSLLVVLALSFLQIRWLQT